MATSAALAGAPVPSTTVPPRMTVVPSMSAPFDRLLAPPARSRASIAAQLTQRQPPRTRAVASRRFASDSPPLAILCRSDHGQRGQTALNGRDVVDPHHMPARMRTQGGLRLLARPAGGYPRRLVRHL